MNEFLTLNAATTCMAVDEACVVCGSADLLVETGACAGAGIEFARGARPRDPAPETADEAVVTCNDCGITYATGANARPRPMRV
ncbi:hypothetical protein [Paraburkholderia caballeronis]|uniref:Uncharacterized protein n=2 Tax=Paraburkholderia caballeronis TaxID=416943 RepID=A0A1H7VH82_9BURK|nr:hypothetical protein [Paraburkholderia caballeronis]PXW16056.1 hypothetical protein C7403_12452 [Paraburkholderia caballeronis]PXW93958.1 hypothetical protein C7407_12452 [Paraburkholderia caballeronis]RAJ89087.1 hypothetical protein C7409_12452 [Paraburkholderia caballeronis]TDV09263.1 hypothetical protein C7408_11685 [Paraburkholderia caballeronis]TDV12323.1 hypothetical protein C7406_11785 [Paraburkholderia caballeronis]